jgi:hypothetical protein
MASAICKLIRIRFSWVLGGLAVLWMAGPSALLARAGGGDGGDGGGGGGGGYRYHYYGYARDNNSAPDFWLNVEIAGVVLAIFAVGLFYVFRQGRVRRRKIQDLLAKLAGQDPGWGQARLEEFARQRFLEIQQAWSSQDLDLLRKRLGTELYADWEKQLKAQAEQGRHNKMDDVTVDKAEIVGVKHYRDPKWDSFLVSIVATAADYTVDPGKNVVEGSKKPGSFKEYWTFQRKGPNDWALLKVDQPEGGYNAAQEPLVDEA